MNEKEIERKLAEILASRGNILPGFSSNGGQLGDQLMVSLDGIRDAIQGIALTSIPPGKIGAVFDRVLQQWYILSNEQPIIIRVDKTERQNKEKPKQPDSTIPIPKTKEYPKILVLHKDPKFDTKLYQYNEEKNNYKMVLDNIDLENLKAFIIVQYYFKEDYFDYHLFYTEIGFSYFDNVEDIKDKYKKCSGQIDVGGDSGSGTQDDPRIPEDIKKMDEIIKSHPGYRFNIFWSVKLLEEFYVMSYFWGEYRTNIKAISSADTFGDLTPIPSSSPLSHESGGTYSSQTNYIKTPDGNFFGWGPYVSCGDVNTCADRTEGNFAEIEYYIAGSSYVVSALGSFSSLTSVLTKQDNFYGSVSGRECQSLYVPQDNVCWIKVQGTHEYTYNYNITGYQALPPNDPDLINDKWPDDGYLGGDPPPPGGYGESCEYPEPLQNIFNIYKIYFYFKKQQYYLDIKCRSRTDQNHHIYYSTYTHLKKENDIETVHYYDIITQKVIEMNKTSKDNITLPLDNYKFIYIDLFYFDETNEVVHNLTLLKYFDGFHIPFGNASRFINTIIPWEYKIYNKNEINKQQYIYKEEDVVYYNENLELVLKDNIYDITITELEIPSMFIDWEVIVENDWRRNISQVFPIKNDEDTNDTECIKNLRDDNFITTTLIKDSSQTVSTKKGDISDIRPDQPIKDFENQPLKEIIFSTDKKININRTLYDYILDEENAQCSVNKIGSKIMQLDGINKVGEGEYSLEGIVYSKNNKTKTII